MTTNLDLTNLKTQRMTMMKRITVKYTTKYKVAIFKIFLFLMKNIRYTKYIIHGGMTLGDDQITPKNNWA